METTFRNIYAMLILVIIIIMAKTELIIKDNNGNTLFRRAFRSAPI